MFIQGISPLLATVKEDEGENKNRIETFRDLSDKIQTEEDSFSDEESDSLMITLLEKKQPP